MRDLVPPLNEFMHYKISMWKETTLIHIQRI